jgi:sulfane dehydrogenase subunit SoxC
MIPVSNRRGRLRPAPESFITPADIARRRFLGAGVALGALAAGAAAAEGERAILELPEHSRTLGAPVASRGYGSPSRHEQAVQRRESPGLTRTSISSIAFAPLQSLFGIITPAGVHFERHHAGWHDIDPAAHRLMLHGLVREPKIYTMDDLMRFPSVSRIHFIECGANTGMEWGNVAVPTVQYTHGMLSCSEFTGVLLSTLLDDVGSMRRRPSSSWPRAPMVLRSRAPCRSRWRSTT